MSSVNKVHIGCEKDLCFLLFIELHKISCVLKYTKVVVY